MVQQFRSNVGIGTTSPSYKLDVAGPIRVENTVYSSDLRLKTDVLPLENAVEGIACLQGVTYRWKAGSGHPPEAPQELQLGLIAQEVEACFPEVVFTDPDGYKSVSYARLVVPLIENAKQQQNLSASLRAFVDSQQHEIVSLRADLAATRSELAATNARLARLEALLDARR